MTRCWTVQIVSGYFFYWFASCFWPTHNKNGGKQCISCTRLLNRVNELSEIISPPSSTSLNAEVRSVRGLLSQVSLQVSNQIIRTITVNLFVATLLFKQGVILWLQGPAHVLLLFEEIGDSSKPLIIGHFFGTFFF